MRITPVRTLAVSASLLMAAGLVAGATAKDSTKTTKFSAPASEPAVSAPNLKVSGYGGWQDGQGRGNVAASASAPLGDHFGVQLDGLYGYGNDNSNGGVGGHAFYRDPSTFLLGATAMWANQDGVNFERYGAEAEVYLGDFTIAPAGGFQAGQARLGDSAYYTIDASYYLTDNLKFTAGSTGYDSTYIGYGAAEWQPNGDTPLSVFATAGGGDEGNGFVLAGVSYTFGAPATSIKKRDRTGDPSNIVKNALDYTGSAINKAGRAVGNAVSGNFGNNT